MVNPKWLGPGGQPGAARGYGGRSGRLRRSNSELPSVDSSLGLALGSWSRSARRSCLVSSPSTLHRCTNCCNSSRPYSRLGHAGQHGPHLLSLFQCQTGRFIGMSLLRSPSILWQRKNRKRRSIKVWKAYLRKRKKSRKPSSKPSPTFSTAFSH